MPLCGYGGYCTRVRGHLGAHTRTPFPGTPAWDRAHDVDRALTLALLDFPAPPWADVLDDEAAAG